jgi:hypothetical protein
MYLTCLSQVKMENMTLRCKCASPFCTQTDAAQMEQLVATMANVAECFRMPVLAETMHWAQFVGSPVL